MDTQILKQLLNRNFYLTNKDKLSRKLFDDDILELYDVLTKSHDRYENDLTTQELFALWQHDNPTATASATNSIAGVITKIENEEPMQEAIASDLLAGLWRRRVGSTLAKLGSALQDGQEDAFARIVELVEKHADGFMPTDFGPETTKDLNKLLEITSDANKFKFNINALNSRVYGIGRGDFGIYAARPEVGKTAFGVSLSCGPGGWCDQGLKVAILGNEEATEKTMLRCYSAWTGMTKPEISAAPHLAIERFELIEDKLTLMNIMGWPIDEVEAYIKHVEADAVIIDQGDKVSVPGNYDAPHLRLRELYTRLREVPKRTNSALLAVSQISADGEGKTVITPDMMEGSKTGKFAEADLIIGIGKYPDNPDGTPDPIRFLTVGKNKISGYHGTIPVKIEPEISRYVD
jgi:replicative DNA helicase